MNSLKIFYLIVSKISLITALSGCRVETDKYPANTPIRADVLTFDSTFMTDPSDVPKIVYGPQNFSVLSNLDNLSGSRLNIYQGGELEIQDVDGEVVAASRFNNYLSPRLDYRVVDGVVKPTTSKTLSLLSASYQFDSLITKTESLTGLKEADFFAGYDKFGILYHPAIVAVNADERIRKYENTNAAYVAGAKQFALYSLSAIEQVPMGFNPQIIAHEFGHAVFEKAFFANRYDRCMSKAENTGRLFPGRLELEFALRGVNEGFADFVSFVWTGSTNVLKTAFGDIGPARERDFSKVAFNYESYSVNNADRPLCQGGYYCIGTLWAKTLLEVFKAKSLDLKSLDSRMTFLREHVGHMTQVGELLRTNNGTRLPAADQQIRECKNREDLSPNTDGEMLGVFFKTLLEVVQESERKLYCSTIEKYFKLSGFPLSARGSCP